MHPSLVAKRASFEAACECIDLVMQAKRARLGNLEPVCADLEAAYADHLTLHKLAYGSEKVIPKHHCRTHGPNQFRADMGVLDMWVVERLNLRVKKVTECILNTRRFEFSALSSLLTKQRNELADEPDLLCKLLGRTTSATGWPGVDIANGALVLGLSLTKGDIVFNGATAGVIQGCAREASKFYVLVNCMEPHGPSWPNAATFKLCIAQQLWSFDHLVEATAWYPVDEHHYVVLR